MEQGIRASKTSAHSPCWYHDAVSRFCQIDENSIIPFLQDGIDRPGNMSNSFESSPAIDLEMYDSDYQYWLLLYDLYPAH